MGLWESTYESGAFDSRRTQQARSSSIIRHKAHQEEINDW